MSTAAELCASTLYQHLTSGEIQLDVGAVIKALNVSAKQQKRLRGHVDKKQTHDFVRSFVEICGDSANALTCVDALQLCYATHGAKFTAADAEWLTTTQLLFDGLDVNNRSMLSIDELMLLCSLLLKAYQSNQNDLLSESARQRMASWLSSIHNSELLPFCHFIRDQMIQSHPTKLGESSKYYVSLLQFRTFFYQLQFSSANQNGIDATDNDKTSSQNNKPTKSKAAMFLSLDSDSDDLPDFDSDSDFELPMSSSSTSKPAKSSQSKPKTPPSQPQATSQSADTPVVLGGWDAGVLLRLTVALQTIWSNFGGGLDLWSSCVFSQMTDSLPTIAAQHRSSFAAMFQFLLQQTQPTRSDMISDPQFSLSLLSQKLYSAFSASNPKAKLPANELQPAITLVVQSYFARIEALLAACDEFLHGKPAVIEVVSRVDVIPAADDHASTPSAVDVPTQSATQQQSSQSPSPPQSNQSSPAPQVFKHLSSIQVTSTAAPAAASSGNTDSKIAVIDLQSLVHKQPTESTTAVTQSTEHVESPSVVTEVSCDLCDSDDEADDNHIEPTETTTTLPTVPVNQTPIQSNTQPLSSVPAIEKTNPYSGITVQVPSNNILSVPIAGASSASSPNAKIERPIKSKQVVRGVTTRPQRLSMPENNIPTTAVELLHTNSIPPSLPVVSEPQPIAVVRSASPVQAPSSDVQPAEPETDIDNDQNIADAPQSMISASDLVELEKNALEWENRAIELARAANLAASAATTLPSSVSAATSASSPVSKQYNPASESSNLAVLSPVLAASTAPPQSWINYLTTVQTASDELRRVSAVVQQLVTQMQHLQHSQSQASQNFFSPLPATVHSQKPTELPKTIEQNRTMADAVFMTPQPYVNTTVNYTTLRAPLSPSLALFESPVSPILADVRTQSNEHPISPSLQSSNQISPPQLKETTRPSSPLFSNAASSTQPLILTRSATPTPPAATMAVRAPTPVMSGSLVLAAPALTPARYGLAVNKLNISTAAEPALPPSTPSNSNTIVQNSNVSIHDLALLLSQQNALLQKLLWQNSETTAPIVSSQPQVVVPSTPASTATASQAQTAHESKPIVTPLVTVETVATVPPAESPVHNISSLSISTPPPQPSVSSPAVAAMLEVMVSPPHRQALMDLLLEMSGLDQKANQPLPSRSPPQLVPTPHLTNHIRSPPRLHTPAYAQSIQTPFMSSLPPAHNVSETPSSGPSSTLAQLTAAVFPVFQQSLSPRQFVDQPKMGAPLVAPTPQYSYASPWQSQALNSSLHASEEEYHSLMGQSNEYENYNLSTSGHMPSFQPRNVRPSASFASRVSRFGPDAHKTQPVKQPTALAGGLRERMLREQQLKEEREQRRRDAAIAADAQSFVRLSQSAAYSTYAYPSRARRPTGQPAGQSAGTVTALITDKKSSSAPVASASVVSLNEIKATSNAAGNTSSAKQLAANDTQSDAKPASRSAQPSASHSTFVRSLRTPSPTRPSPTAQSAANSVPASSLNVPSSQQKQLQYLSKLQKAAASLLGPAHVEWMTKPIVQNVKPARPTSARMKF